MDKIKIPLVRISPKAHKHLIELVFHFNELSGLNISLTRYLSKLIMAQTPEKNINDIVRFLEREEND